MRVVVLSQILLFFVVSFSGKGLADFLVEKKGMIAGASHVNLRSGPGISHPALKILRSGEEVDVESLEGSWYRVGLSDGKRGYVYKGLLYLLGKEEIEVAKAQPATEQVKDIAENYSTEPLVEAPTEEITAESETEVAKIDSVTKRVREVVERQPFTEQRETPKEVDLTESNGGREKSSSKVPRYQPEILNVQLVEKELPEAKTLLPIEMGRERLLEIAAWFAAALCIFILGWIFGGNYYLRRDRNERNKLHF
ncbi:MAG: SH3 domain-containing protein [Deltaproteobacteria bacterium]|nr:SH3 domain-containing protein [Deltaproteobacteria bacterium]